MAESERCMMDERRMREIEENFADAIVGVPADEPLAEGLIKRARTKALRRIVARHAPGNKLYDLAVAELARRNEEA